MTLVIVIYYLKEIFPVFLFKICKATLADIIRHYDENGARSRFRKEGPQTPCASSATNKLTQFWILLETMLETMSSCHLVYILDTGIGFRYLYTSFHTHPHWLYFLSALNTSQSWNKVLNIRDKKWKMRNIEIKCWYLSMVDRIQWSRPIVSSSLQIQEESIESAASVSGSPEVG